MGKSGVAEVQHGAFAMEACRMPCHFVGRKSFSSCSLLAVTYWVCSGREQITSAVLLKTLLVYTHHCQSLAKVPQFRAGFHGNCMLLAVHGPRWAVSVFDGIWAPPLGTPSEAHYICSSLICRPRRFEWCTAPAGLRSEHCAMSPK